MLPKHSQFLNYSWNKKQKKIKFDCVSAAYGLFDDGARARATFNFIQRNLHHSLFFLLNWKSSIVRGCCRFDGCWLLLLPQTYAYYAKQYSSSNGCDISVRLCLYLCVESRRIWICCNSVFLVFGGKTRVTCLCGCVCVIGVIVAAMMASAVIHWLPGGRCWTKKPQNVGQEFLKQ